MSNQIIIQVILIAALGLVALAIVWPSKGTRGQAIRTLAWLIGLTAGAIAVIFPSLTSTVANWLGVGRGTDLVLYMAIVFFMGYAVTTTAHRRRTDRTMTQLARKIALLEAELRKRGELDVPRENSDDSATTYPQD
ncbi:DUF2304 domain-containing protein [Arcanobacterium haemolyticum]|nr:DUF2304 domain-containing protein [Arcanobacterium haemolyticum]